MNHHMTCKHSKTSIFVDDVIKSATISLITMKKNTRQTHPKSSTTIANIPDGYTIGTGPDGQQYLVPQFMVPDLDQAFTSYCSKTELDVSNSQAGVSKRVPSAIWSLTSCDGPLCQHSIGLVISIQIRSACEFNRRCILICHFAKNNLQCSQSQERGFVELGEVLLAFPPDPVSICIAAIMQV